MGDRPVLLVLGNAQSEHLPPWLRPFTDDYDVHLATLDPSGRTQGWTEHALGRHTRSPLDYFLARPAFQRLVDELRPDLLHVHYATGYGSLGAAVRTAAPRLLTVWGSDVTRTPQGNPLIRAMLRRSLRAYRWFNAPAEHLKAALVSLGAMPAMVDVFPYGVPTRALPWRAARPGRERVRILSPRNWHLLYRIDAIIAGFETLVQGGENAELVITGRGSAEAEAKAVTDRVAASPARERIQLLGYVSRQRLVEEMAAADAFVSVPVSDGAATSVLECLAVGLFPVASELAANRAWFSEPDAAYVTTASPADMAAALGAACRAVRGGFDGAAKARMVRETADYDANIQRLRAVYERLRRAP